MKLGVVRGRNGDVSQRREATACVQVFCKNL